MKEQIIYYLLDNDKDLMKANRNGFLKVFSKSKPGLKEWIEANEIDFEAKDDLMRVYEYCVSK